MKHFIYIFLLLISFVSCKKQVSLKEQTNPFKEIEAIAEAQKEFAIENNLSTKYCILVNYKIPSGKKRVFVYDFRAKKIVYTAHTMHGAGRNSTNETPEFSNMLGSHCSSLGHFKITKQHGYINPDGFRLIGLDKENNNAYKRGLMLHSSWWVDYHIGNQYIPLNNIYCQGCVTTSIKELETLSKFIYNEKKLLLLIAINK